MLIRTSLLLVTFLALVTACASLATAPTGGESNLSLAPTSGCAVPCWRDITPGATTSEQAQSRLESLFGEQAIARDGDILSWEVTEGVKGRAALADGHVRTVTFTLAPGSLTVEQLLNQVGKPSEVHISLPHVPRDAGAAARQCDLLRLRYSQQNLEATLHESESGSVLSGHSISRLYLAPTRPTLSMMTPFYRRSWTGYGSYCIILDEVFER